MRRDPIRLRSGHQALLYLAFGLLFLTGIVWAVIDHGLFLTGGGAGPAKAMLMRVHGAAAMAALVLVGTLFPGHVRLGWLLKRNRANGLFIIAVVAFLVLTGYGLYYEGNEFLRTWTSWTHLGVGAAFPLVLGVHILLGRRTRRRVCAPQRGEL